MAEQTALKFIGAQPPSFSKARALDTAKKLFDVTGNLTPLWGERDQNFKIEDDSHDGYVLKISNSREHFPAVDCQIKAMQHLSRHGELLVPGVKPLRDGSFYGVVKDEQGTEHLVHMVELLQGVTLSDVPPCDQLIYSAGQQAGRAAFGLRGYFHPAAAQQLYWDVRALPQYAKFVAHIDDMPLRMSVEKFMADFEHKVLPRLSRLRTQYIHHDTTPDNVLVSVSKPHRVTGLIDFGDMIHGSIVQDIAAAAEVIPGGDGMLESICALVQGYDEAMPLEEAEIDLVYDFMVARYVTGLLIGITRKLYKISSTNDMDYINLYRPPLELLLQSGREETRAVLRHCCRFPHYCPPLQLKDEKSQLQTDELIKRRHRILGKELALTYDNPLHIVRGQGVWLYDVSGRAYLDCYNNVPCVGHCHPHVVKALSRQSAALNTNTRYLFENVVEYAERLAATMPGDLGACLFVNSGSEANDLALRMAKICTEQDGAIIIDGAYHGITSEIYALSPAAEWGMHSDDNKVHISQLRKDIGILANPDILRGQYRDRRTAGEHYAADTDRAIAALKAAGHQPGAFIVDSSFSTHGILNVPDHYLESVVKRVRSAGGLFIADEVQYGYGRSGEHFWGFQNHDVTPDFVTLGKPIGNGLALGVVVTTPDILERFTRQNEFFSTFGGNPVACAAAMAVMDVIERENLVENSKTTGSYLKDGLISVSAQNPKVGDIRGKGLFLGVDIVSNKSTMTADAIECKRIQNHLRENGCLVGTEGIGGNILKVRPPLVFQKKHADKLIDAFAKALSA